MGLRGPSVHERQYTPLGRKLRDSKFEHIDRQPIFPRGIKWTRGVCKDCSRSMSLIKSVDLCGECYLRSQA